MLKMSGKTNLANTGNRPLELNVAALPLYTQVRESLRRDILNGTYPPHSQMPSEPNDAQLRC